MEGEVSDTLQRDRFARFLPNARQNKELDSANLFLQDLSHESKGSLLLLLLLLPDQ